MSGQDEFQWQVVLVAVGLVLILHNFDRTFTTLVASANIDWRFICFLVGFKHLRLNRYSFKAVDSSPKSSARNNWLLNE